MDRELKRPHLRPLSKLRQVTLLVTALVSPMALAHSPHDVINVVRAAPGADGGAALFVVVSGNVLMRSRDGGVSWRRLVDGLDNRHPMLDLEYGMAAAGVPTLLLATDGDGLYRSTDFGDTWSPVGGNLPTRRIGRLALAADFASSASALAAGVLGGLYSSQDGGTVWSTVLPESAIIDAIWTGRKDRYLAGSRDGRVYQSADGGATWNLLSELGEVGGVTALALAGPEDTILAGSGSSGVLASVDGGVTFERTAPCGTDLSIRAVTPAPTATAPGRVFASCWHAGVSRSLDGGRTWEISSQGLTRDAQADDHLHHSPHFMDVEVHASGGEGELLLAGGFDGLFLSTDEARQWTELDTLSERSIVGLAAATLPGGGTRVALATYGGGAYIRDADSEGWIIANAGLSSPRLSEIAFAGRQGGDPVLITGARDALLTLDSPEDSWRTLRLSRGGVADVAGKVLRKVRLDKLLQDGPLGELLGLDGERGVFPQTLVPLPTLKGPQSVLAGTRYSGVVEVSLDDGRLQTVFETDSMVSSLAASPAYAHDRTLFVARRQDGVFRSIDNGRSWQAVNSGLDFLDDWRAMGDEPERATAELERSAYFNLQILLSPDFERDQTAFLATGEGLFRSTDGGLTWARAPGLSSRVWIQALATSPRYREDRTLYVVLRGLGVMRSRDAGNSFHAAWQSLREQYHDVPRWLAPADGEGKSQVIYVASPDEIYESTDGGEHWRVLPRPLRLENERPPIRYQGTWKRLSGAQYSAGGAAVASTIGSTATLRFSGTSVRWLGDVSPGGASCRVFLDGELQATVTAGEHGRDQPRVVYAAENLQPGVHTLRLEVSNAGGGGAVVLDALEVN